MKISIKSRSLPFIISVGSKYRFKTDDVSLFKTVNNNVSELDSPVLVNYNIDKDEFYFYLILKEGSTFNTPQECVDNYTDDSGYKLNLKEFLDTLEFCE